MNEIIEKEMHVINMDNRKLIRMSGVLDVDAFNESEIMVKTSAGKLLVKGNKLHVDTLDLKSGCLVVTGVVDALVYSNNSAQKSKFKRMFS